MDDAPSPDEDLDFVERTLRGELDAFEVLVERHRDAVYRVAARMVGEPEADDVTQDALLRAFHKLETFRRESSFRSWLLRIAHNRALNVLASRRAQPAEVFEDAGEPPESDRPPLTPAQSLELHERRERLARKLGDLRPAHRSVLVLRDLEGMSYEEIAHVTESPLGSVKGRLHRARLELIELLRRNTYDWELPRDP